MGKTQSRAATEDTRICIVYKVSVFQLKCYPVLCHGNCNCKLTTCIAFWELGVLKGEATWLSADNSEISFLTVCLQCAPLTTPTISLL